MLPCLHCHQQNACDLELAKLPRKISNTRIFEKYIFFYSNIPIVRHGNTKYSRIYLSFINIFSTIANI